MQDIEMSFPGVRALKQASLTLRRGEVHALMGENGAGKSTMVKCLTGVYHKDSGEIIYDGKKIEPTTPQAAVEMGISTVYQEINLCPNLTVAENMFIGRQPLRGKLVDWKTMNRRSVEVLRRFNINIDVTRPLSTYSVAIQQLVSIARAVDVDAKILILDEPTSSLDEQEVRKLFEIMRQLRSEGLAIVFITHFLDQVYEISDRITVLRNGEMIGEYEVKNFPKIDLVTKMIGKELSDLSAISRVEKSDDEKQIIVEAEDICVAGKISDVNMQLRTGEVLGFAGLLGSGRTESAETLFGVQKAHRGNIKIKNKQVNLRSPADAIKNNIAFCPEDRKRDGIIADLSIRENIILAIQARQGLLKKMPLKQQQELADKYIKLLGIATPDAEKKIGELSGGNQQKVILARWLATEPEVLILDEPTRGIDVGAKAEIQKLTLSLCEKGLSLVFISSEIDEVMRVSNRIVVMRDRRKVGEIESSDFSQERILSTIAGGESK
jgi:simple sugar transport system ATP-binding protein